MLTLYSLFYIASAQIAVTKIIIVVTSRRYKIPVNVLFVCVENAGRSQMAEAFFRELAPKWFHAKSAGTVPSSALNGKAVNVMQEIGIDMARQEPKLLSNDILASSSKIVNTGCIDKEECPALLAKDASIINWNIPDPKNSSLEDVRKIRDQIRENVTDLVESLEETDEIL